MPSSLPTREEGPTSVEIVGRVNGTTGFAPKCIEATVWLPDLGSFKVQGDVSHIACGDEAMVSLPVRIPAAEARQAEAPEGETETGDGLVMARWGGYKPAPPSVPVFTERTDEETDGVGSGHDDEWNVSGGAAVGVEMEDDIAFLNVSGALATLDGEDRARLVRALGGTNVPASLPPLTDEVIDRAAGAAHEEWREGTFSRPWDEIGATARAKYAEPFRAALASTGLYATPREKG